ncbi:unnamed protein product [Rhizoctonia solani]|uniref:Uncharacterized protein n=1 Tax=Rhizoctonia solani TaxID=456999 RepID=A0A8H3HK91_9AGAM|nr:unnamed protein product [Rhizoctonia solani]
MQEYINCIFHANRIFSHILPITMDTPGLSCAFVNVADTNNTTPYSERNHLIAPLEPIQGVWYTSSLAQDEGWFCKPMYFVDGGEDGIQHVFCWSLSIDEGSGLNYLWRVNWNFHSEPTLSFYQRFQEHGLCHLEIHGYLFFLRHV